MHYIVQPIYSIYSLWRLGPSGNASQSDGHGRRASTFPSLLVQSFPFYQQLFYKCTPSPNPSILQLAFLSS